MHGDMESQIHYLEQVAYSSVLRAFKAQSDHLTWEKEGLITELRKELRVSDDEHRELLAKVNDDDVICQIREWRSSGGNQNALMNVPQSVHDPVSTMSGSRKRQKPSISLHSQPHAIMGPGVNTPKPSPRYPLLNRTPRGMLSNLDSPAVSSANEPAGGGTRDPLIGKKVRTRWPDDENFYEAVIVDYNPVQGRHALVYNTNTREESFEWVNLKEIPPKDIQWVADDSGISHQTGHGGQGQGFNNHISQALVPRNERGRGTPKDQFRKGFPPLQNGAAQEASDEIEILHTDTLIKQVEKVFDASNPDLLEIEKVKKMLKDHERALIDVIAKLADASDSDSDGEQPMFPGQSTDERVTRSLQHGGNQYASAMPSGSLTAVDNQTQNYA